MPARARWMAPGLLLLSTALYVGLAGSPALVDDDIDAAHALVAREMLQRHDFVVMYQDGIRYLIRPPLHFWLVGASYAALGESAFATRLPVALAMVGLVMLTFSFGRRFFGERAGFYAGLAVATSFGMFLFTRTVIPEAIYALEFTAIFLLFLRSWTGSLDSRIGLPAAAAICALAVLTRGPIGFLFPAGAIALFLTLSRGWRRWRELHLVTSGAVFLAIAVPWHVLAEIRSPGFLWAYFVNEHVNRAFGTREPHDYGAVPLWLWWLEHLAWLFPWSLFAPLLYREFPRPRTWGPAMDAPSQARLLLFAWAGTILGFFTLEGGSRMEYYSFGAWPALALLLGVAIADAEGRDATPVLWVTRVLAALGALFAVGAGAFLWISSRTPQAADITTHLHTHDAEFYRNAMARVLDLTPQALADLRVPLIVSAASLGGGFVLAWLLRKQGVPSPRRPCWPSPWWDCSPPRTSRTSLSSRLCPHALSRWKSTRPWVRGTRSCCTETSASLRASPSTAIAASCCTPPKAATSRSAPITATHRRRSCPTPSSSRSGESPGASSWWFRHTRRRRLLGGSPGIPRECSPRAEGRPSTSIERPERPGRLGPHPEREAARPSASHRGVPGRRRPRRALEFGG